MKIKKRWVVYPLIILMLTLGAVPTYASSIPYISFSKHMIDDHFDGASSIYAADIDSDGDIDVLGAAYEDNDIAWWENNGSGSFTKHIIDYDFGGVFDVYAIDIDGDGDIDVLGAAYEDDDIAWWENDGHENFTKHIIDYNFDGASSIYAADVNGDGDIDVIGAAWNGDDVSWWENDSHENFTKHRIGWTGWFSVYPYDVYPTDIDSDGDMDIIATSVGYDEIRWWENVGGENFIRHLIASSFYGARSVYAADIDGDGDIDVLGAASDADDIAWWENDGHENFTKHIIDYNFYGARSVYAADIDGDGDVDVLGAATDADDIAWWENDGHENFTKHIIDWNFDGACSVYATDIDGDGNVDILGAARDADDIAWWENLNTPPTVTISAYYHAVGDNTITFTGTATDMQSNIASVEYKVDNSSWMPATASDGAFDEPSESYTFSTVPLADGAHTVYVRATDSTNNTTGEADYASVSFTLDTTPPTVATTSPESDVTDIAVDTTVSATFSEPMDSSTINTSSFTLVGSLVSGTVSYNATTYTATFTPTTNLEYDHKYTAILSTAISDTAGNALANTYSWSFITREINNPPYLPSNPSPSNHAPQVPINADLSWTGGDPDVGDTVTYDIFFGTGNVIPCVFPGQAATTYDPGVLKNNTTYHWSIYARDIHGAATDGPVWDFTTAGAASATRTLPASVDPGADFTVGIEASGCGMCGQVVETLPSGFSYVGTDSTDVYVTQDGNAISFTFTGDSVTFTYTVKASTTAGTYSFSGVVKDENKIEYTIGGDISVGFAPWAYDADGDGVISKVEALNAVVDYFAGDITKAQALEVIALYFT